MLVVIIILNFEPSVAESSLIFLPIRLGKTLITGSPRMNEVEDIINHQVDPPIGVSIDILWVHRHGCEGFVRVISQL